MTHSRSLARSTAELFEATLQSIEGKLAIVRKEDRVGIKLLSKFQGLKDYNTVFVHKVTELRGVNNSVIILLIEKHLTIIEHRKTGRIEKGIEEIEPILLFSVPQEMGRVWIRPETISDKLTDLITKVDIDFKNYPAFSSNYFVAGENPDLIRKYLPIRLLDSLNHIKGLTVEIDGNWGMMRLEKNLTEDVLLLLISVGYQLTR